MKLRKSALVFVWVVAFLVVSFVVYMVFEGVEAEKEFFDLLQRGDEAEFNKFIVEISNKSFSRYVYFVSLKDYFEGREEEAISNLVTLISNRSVSEREIGVSKFIVGYYLMFEKNDVGGMEFVLSPESYKYFSEYVNYVVGLYNFEKEDYDKAMKFFLSITNSKDENLRKDVLSRIAFIELKNSGKVSKDVRYQLRDIDKKLFYELIKE